MPAARRRARRVPAAGARAELLFAYGTLMRGHALYGLLAQAATLREVATVRGALLDLGRYPGLIEGRGRVHGELYALRDRELLAVLDRKEGYTFERRRVTVTLAGGRRARAWTYTYRGSRARAVPIPEGDDRRIRWR